MYIYIKLIININITSNMLSVNTNANHYNPHSHSFLSLPKTTSPPHTFLSKKRITKHASTLLSPCKTNVHSTNKAKLVHKSSITMYKHIILKTKEYYDKAITEERNQGVVNSPIRISKNDDIVHISKTSPFMLLSKSNSNSNSNSNINMNCNNVKRNLMDYFNNHSNSSIMQGQINVIGSKSKCLTCNGGNGEFKQKSLRDFFKR